MKTLVQYQNYLLYLRFEPQADETNLKSKLTMCLDNFGATIRYFLLLLKLYAFLTFDIGFPRKFLVL